MRRALELAERGRGRVSPNPLVGCVLVDDEGRAVGEGWHAELGGPHAEVVALTAAGKAARGSTAYVTLEPCAHHGRTGPCTEALIAAGVARVVIAQLDPDPRVDGRGVERLRAAGIEVESGLLAAEAAELNEAYLVSRREQRPFVLYKTAMSLDGKIATRTGSSRWLTGEASRARVHEWRDEVDAVALGVTTVLRDDPALTTRLPGGRTPLKVVFDSHLRTPPTAKLLEPDLQGVPARVVVYTKEGAPVDHVERLERRGANVVVVPPEDERPSVPAALRDLHGRSVRSLILEGGGTLAWAFLASRSVDGVAWFVAPKLIGGPAPSPLAGTGVEELAAAFHIERSQVEKIGDDLLIRGRVVYPEVT